MSSYHKYIKALIIAISCMICGFLFPVSGRQVTVAKIKKLPVIVGQWQRMSFIKNGIKSDLKSDYIFEFSPDATYLFIKRIPIQSSSATGAPIYTHKIIEKGQWRLLQNERFITLKGYTFASKDKIENELNNVLSLSMDNKTKNQFSVKKLDGRYGGIHL